MGSKLRCLFLLLIGVGHFSLIDNEVSAQCNPAAPVASFSLSMDSIVCSGTNIQFISTSSAYKGSTYWDFGDLALNNDTASGDTVTYTFYNTTVASKLYHVLLLVIDSCGNLDSVSQNIYVTRAFSAGFSIPSGVYTCDSASVSFSNSSTGTGLTYSWDFGDPSSGSLNSSTVREPSHRFDIGSSLDTFLIKLVVSDTCGNSDSLTRQLIVFPLPQANFSFTDSLCSGIVNFTNSSNGSGLTYSWNFGDPSSGSQNTSNASQPNHNFDTIGSGFVSYTVRLTATNIYGCSDSEEKDVFIRRGPDPKIDDFTSSTPFTQCSNSSSFVLTIDNSSTTSNNAYYLIDWGDTSGVDSLTNFTQDTHTYTGFGLRNIVVRVVDNVGCSKSDTFGVFNGSNPSGGLASPGSTINLCSPIQLGFPLTSVSNNPNGTTYTLTVNDGGSPVTYTHPPPDTVYHLFNQGSCGSTVNGTTTYNNAFAVTLTITNPCGFTASSILPITISGKPKAAIKSSHDTACIQKDLVFIDDISSGAEYVTQVGSNFTCDTVPLRRWRIDRPSSDYTLVQGFLGGAVFNNNSTQGANGNGSPALRFRFTDTGRFVISLLSGYPTNNTTKCGYDSTAYVIYVVDTVVAGFNFSMNPSNGCINNSFTPSNLSKGPIKSYQWTISPTTGFSFQTGNQFSQTPTLRFTQAGVFTVNLKVFGYCNDDDTTATIIIRSKPQVQLPADQTYCGAKSINFSGLNHAPIIDTNFSSISAHRWRVLGGAVSFEGGTDSSSLYPQIKFQDTGWYDVFFTATNACGESSADTQRIHIKPIPSMGSLSAIEVCPGDSIYPPAFVSNPTGASFTWTNSNTSIGLAASGTGQIAPFIAANNTSGNVREGIIKIISSIYGCSNTGDTLRIRVKPKPVLNAISDIDVCPGDSVIIPAFSATPNGASFSWTNTNDSIGLGTSGSGSISSFIAPLNTGSAAIIGRIHFTASLNGCSSETDSFDIGIRTHPNMTGLVDTVICPDISFSYPSFNSVPSGASFTWYNSNTTIGLSDSGTGNLPSFTSFHNTSGTNQSTNIIVYPDYNGCLGTPDTFVLSVRPAPEIYATNDSSICPGDSVFIPTFSASPSGSSFSWTNNQTATGLAAAGNGNIANFKADSNTTGTNLLSRIIVVPSLNGCLGFADTFFIIVKPRPIPQAVSDILVCPNDSVFPANFSSSPAGASFAWSNSNTSIGLSGSGTGNVPDFAASANGSGNTVSAWIVYTPTLSACIGPSDSFNIEVKPSPIMVTQPDIEVCTWQQVQVNGFTSSPAGSSFSWTNTNTSNGLSGSGSGSITNYLAPANTTGSLISGSVRVVPTLNSCVGIADTFEIRIRPQPNADAGLDDTLCAGQSVQIGQAAQSDESYSWTSIPSGFSDTASNVSVNPNSSTRYILSVYDSITGCQQRDTVGILVNPILSSNSISNDQIICAGQTPNPFSGSSPSGGNTNYSYQWQLSTDSSTWNDIAGANSSNYSSGSLQVNTHFRRVVVSGPCSDTSAVLRVMVLPALANNYIGASDSICALFAPDTLRGSLPTGGNGGFTYSWQLSSDSTQTPSSISGANGRNYFPGVLSSTTYFRRVVTSGACVVPGNWVEIRVKPKPVALFTVNNACYDFAHNFTSQSTISSGSISSYSWDFGDTSGSTSQNPSHTYGYSGAKTAKLIISSDFGCKDSVSKTLHVHPKPVAAFDSTNACFQLANIFTNQSSISSGSLNAYAWTFGDGSGSSTLSPSHIYGDTGTYSVRLIVTSDSGCMDSAFKSVEVYAKPIAGIIAEDICFNQTSHFTDTSSISAGSIVYREWHFGDGDTSSTRHPVHNYSAADTFAITLYVRSDRGCLDTAEGEAIVYPSISNNSIGQDDTICAGSQTASLSGTNPQGGTGSYMYQWQSSTDTINWGDISNGTSLSLGSQTLNTSTWFRRIVRSSPCDSNEAHISNRVFILVTAGITNNSIGISDSICALFAPDTLRGSLPQGGTGSYAYGWEFASDSTATPSSISNTNQKDFYPGTLSSTSYYRRSVSSGSCETRSNWVEIRVKPKPVASFIVNNACYDFVHNFTNQSTISSGSIASYSWDFGDTSGSAAQNPSHTYGYSGAKTAKLIISSDFGCKDSISKTLHVHPKPVAAFDSTNACFQLANVFTNQSSISSGSLNAYAWTFGDGSGSSTLSPSHIYGDTGTYSVRLIVTSDSGCMDSAFKSVEVYAKPVAGMITEDVCFNQTSHFTDTSTISAGSIAYREWHFGDGDTSSTLHPVHNYSSADTFAITLYVSSDRGCLDTAEGEAIVYPSITNNSISQDDTICAGSSTNAFSGLSPQGGTGTYTYLWQSSTDTVNWIAISGGNTQNMTAQSPSVSTYYRRIVSSSPCDSNEQSISNRIFIVVTAGIGNNNITGDQVICYGQSPDTLIGSSPNGGTGNFTYQWQSSSDGVNWTNINGAVSQQYWSPALTDTMYFRRNVYSQACDLSSNSIKVAVKPLPEPGFTLANTCFPEAAVFSDTSIINQGNLPSRVFLFGDGDSSNSSNPSHYYATAGSYTVKLIVRSNFGCVDSLSRNYVVYPKPDAKLYQQNICFPFAMDLRDTSTISTGNITGWRWRLGDGDSSNSQHLSKAYSADGVYSVDLEVTSDFGCKDTAVQNIRVFPKPTPAFGSAEVCFPNITNFYDSSSINSGQNQAWQWDFGDGSTANQQNPSHAYSVAGTYTVKLRVVSDSNCIDSLSKTIEVRPLPIVNFLLDTLGCLNATNTFTNQTQLSQSQIWTFGNGQSDTSFNSQSTYNSIGSYAIRLVATSPYGCVDSTDRRIRIIAPPVAAIDLSLDSGCGPLLISYSNTSVNEFPSYQWDLGDGSFYNDTFPPPHNYAPSLFNDTTYQIRLIAQNKCGIDSAIDSVRVLPVPTAVLGQAQSQGCSPLHLQLMNGSYGRPYSYTWHYGDGDTSNQGLGIHTHIFLTGNMDTNYSISLIARNACGVDTAFGSVLVKPNTVTAFFNTDTTRGCEPLNIQFTDYSVGGNYLYYDFGNGNTSLSANPSHVFTGPGVYTIRQFVDNGCAYDTASIQIEVLPNVVPQFQVTSSPECVGTNLSFVNQTAGVGALRWYFGDGDSSDLTSAQHAYATDGSYQVTLRVISALNGCPASASQSVQVIPLPQMNLSVPSNQACPPFSPSFQNNSSSGLFYQWDFGDGNTAAGQNPGHTYSITGAYTVKLTATSASGCVDSTELNILVHPVPTASFTQSFDTECDTPASVQFTNTSNGAVQYAWTFGDGSQSVVNNPSHAYHQFATYSIQLRAGNAFQCWDTASSLFTVYTVPITDFTFTPDSGCMPLEVQFSNTSQNTNTYLWDFGDGNFSTQQDPLHTYLQAGIYSPKLIATDGGSCVDSSIQTNAIDVFPKPVSNFSFIQIDNDPIAKGLVQFTNQSQFASRYYWSFGDGDESEEINPEHRYRFHGSYFVQLAVVNQYGCEDTSIQEIPLNFFKGLFVPNAFTPEYGIPEVRVFKPSGTSLKTYRLRIFDTYGNLLWETTELVNSEPAVGWDGRVDGKLINQDVYVWKIEAEFLDGTSWPGMKGEDGKFRKEGTVSLIR